MDRVLQRRGALPSASIVGASHPPDVKRHRRPKIRSSQWPPVPRSRGVTVLSSACRLTSAVSLGLFCRCCLTVPVDNRRPPRHHLQVPSTRLEDQRRWPWLSVWPGVTLTSTAALTRAGTAGMIWHPAGWLGSAGSCTGAWGSAGMRCSNLVMRCCAGRMPDHPRRPRPGQRRRRRQCHARPY